MTNGKDAAIGLHNSATTNSPHTVQRGAPATYAHTQPIPNVVHSNCVRPAIQATDSVCNG